MKSKLIKYTLCVMPLFAFAQESKLDNYYIGLNVGQSQSQSVGGYFPSTNAGKSPVYGAEIGYKFNDHFRAGLSVDYRDNYKLTYMQPDPDEEDLKYQYNIKVNSLATMLNVYYDITNFHGFTPYLVGGIGVSRNKTYNNTVSLISEGGNIVSSISSKKETNLATKIGLGAKYQINQHFDVGLQYHYVNLGSFKTGNQVTLPSGKTESESIKKGHLKVSEIVFKLTYKF